MIILGIDPGYGRMGWGVLEYDGKKAKYIASNCLSTSADLPFCKRLESVFDQVVEVITKYKPQSVAVESIFFNTNAKTAILASQARGAIILAGVKNGIDVFDYTPLQVKQALIGYGRAEKKQIQTMLKFHLNMAKAPTQDDEADALAVALTHAYTNQKLR